MPETRLVDYSFARPRPDDIKASGYRGAMRYLSRTAGKNLTAGEAKRLHAKGLAIGLVWETTATRATKGHVAGAADRKTAEAMARRLGYPKTCPIFYAVDEDTTAAAVADYFAGVFEANTYPAGPYGGIRVVDGVHKAHPAAVVWQTAAWSAGKLSKHAHLYQRVGHEAKPIPGGGYDENVVCKPLRLWGPRGPVTITPPGNGKPRPHKKPKRHRAHRTHGGWAGRLARACRRRKTAR